MICYIQQEIILILWLPTMSENLPGIVISFLQQAAICLCNIAHHGPEYLKRALELGAMDAFINIIKSPDQDTIVTGLQFVEMALRNFPASKEMFETGEGVACLEALEYSCNETVAQYANELLDTHFIDEGAHGYEESDGGDGSGVVSWRQEGSEMTS